MTSKAASVVAQIPTVVGLSSLQVKENEVQVTGLSLRATQVVGTDGLTSTSFEPLRMVLGGTSHPVLFVMGWTLQDGKEVKRISLLGPDVVPVRVGQTLSFVPMNAQAADHMLGSAGEQGGFSGISVYAAPPGAQLRFYQAAQIFANVVHLTEPGTYEYAIAPPGYSAMAPDAKTAALHVIVVK